GAREVVDVRCDFEHEGGSGLQMQLVDSSGAVIASGQTIRSAAAQGATLYIHVFGQGDAAGPRGVGAYTLDIDVLPQLASVEGQPLVPGVNGIAGGPTASLVLTFQGDRLDQAAAQNPANYTVTWLGSDGIAGTADDRIVAINAANAQAVVYDPSANVDI